MKQVSDNFETVRHKTISEAKQLWKDPDKDNRGLAQAARHYENNLRGKFDPVFNLDAVEKARNTAREIATVNALYSSKPVSEAAAEQQGQQAYDAVVEKDALEKETRRVVNADAFWHSNGKRVAEALAGGDHNEARGRYTEEKTYSLPANRELTAVRSSAPKKRVVLKHDTSNPIAEHSPDTAVTKNLYDYTQDRAQLLGGPNIAKMKEVVKSCLRAFYFPMQKFMTVLAGMARRLGYHNAAGGLLQFETNEGDGSGYKLRFHREENDSTKPVAKEEKKSAAEASGEENTVDKPVDYTVTCSITDPNNNRTSIWQRFNLLQDRQGRYINDYTKDPDVDIVLSRVDDAGRVQPDSRVLKYVGSHKELNSTNEDSPLVTDEFFKQKVSTELTTREAGIQEAIRREAAGAGQAAGDAALDAGVRVRERINREVEEEVRQDIRSGEIQFGPKKKKNGLLVMDYPASGEMAQSVDFLRLGDGVGRSQVGLDLNQSAAGTAASGFILIDELKEAENLGLDIRL